MKPVRMKGRTVHSTKKIRGLVNHCIPSSEVSPQRWFFITAVVKEYKRVVATQVLFYYPLAGLSAHQRRN